MSNLVRSRELAGASMVLEMGGRATMRDSRAASERRLRKDQLCGLVGSEGPLHVICIEINTAFKLGEIGGGYELPDLGLLSPVLCIPHCLKFFR